jgi:hypothetical protein
MNVKRIPLQDLPKHVEGAIDAFVCSVSFEQRCLSVAEHLSVEEVKKVLVAKNAYPLKKVADNLERFNDIFGDKVKLAELDGSRPLITADALRNALDKSRDEGVRKYLIDITTFTHESLLILVRLIHEFRKKDEAYRMVYTGAADYSVGDKDEDKWLSKGCKDIRSVLGFSGTFALTKKVHLIVLVGFEHERATQLINEYEPHVLSLGCSPAEESIMPHHHRPNLHFQQMVSRMTPTLGRVHSFEFSCRDPFAGKEKIKEQIAKFPDHNVVISPMNTKISTIGAALAALEDEKVQVCYVQPEQYNYEHYSIPDDHCYIFSF